MAQGAFELDKQTLDDLALFTNNRGDNSIFKFFDRAVTIGGSYKLREFFDNPLTDREQIAQRLAAIEHLQRRDIGFKVERGSCDYIEFYLSQHGKPTAAPSKIKAIERKVMYYFTNDSDFYTIHRGIIQTLELLMMLQDIIQNNTPDALPILLQNFYLTINDTLQHPDFAFVYNLFNKKKLNGIDIGRADHLFRYLGFARLKALLDIVYQLDVFTSVAQMAKRNGFCLPTISNNSRQVLKLENVYHPFIKDAVGNSISFSYDKNVCFVTGANMAGKSTFLKSVGISVYLSQLGFPVPARSMETSVFEGLITTINLSDNLQHGNSHFYTEVARVKHVAKVIERSQNVLVIFDELFRGTNVKDAFDASLSIISAFAKLRKSFFIVSTHIVEVAHELAEIGNISFKFMETTFDNDVPQYSYKLQNGITEERLGMWIVKNEGIVEIIEGILKIDEVEPRVKNQESRL
jgi:DNA mismatch repair protein MutS